MENSLNHASLPDPSEPYEYETAYQRVFRPDKRLPDDAELKRFAALDAVARYPAGERAEIVLRALSALIANPAGALDAAAVASLAPVSDFLAFGEEIWREEDASAALALLTAAMR